MPLSNPLQNSRYRTLFDPNLRDILLSHIMVAEMARDCEIRLRQNESDQQESPVLMRSTGTPGNLSERTLIRVHLIPYTPNITSQEEQMLGAGTQNTLGRVLRQRVVANDSISCFASRQKRNTHVEHLPKYQKLDENTLKKFSDDICPICHKEFVSGEYYRTLPICNHSFHKKCIDKWFRKDNAEMRCPLCRVGHSPDKWRIFNENQENTMIIQQNRELDLI